MRNEKNWIVDVFVVLVKYIKNDEKIDCVVEAFRVLGNLSRAKKIRDILVKCKGKRNDYFSINSRKKHYFRKISS